MRHHVSWNRMTRDDGHHIPDLSSCRSIADPSPGNPSTRFLRMPLCFCHGARLTLRRYTSSHHCQVACCLPASLPPARSALYTHRYHVLFQTICQRPNHRGNNSKNKTSFLLNRTRSHGPLSFDKEDLDMFTHVSLYITSKDNAKQRKREAKLCDWC